MLKKYIVLCRATRLPRVQARFRPSVHTDLVSLLFQFHDLVEIGHAPLLLSLPVQLQSPHLQL